VLVSGVYMMQRGACQWCAWCAAGNRAPIASHVQCFLCHTSYHRLTLLTFVPICPRHHVWSTITPHDNGDARKAQYRSETKRHHQRRQFQLPKHRAMPTPMYNTADDGGEAEVLLPTPQQVCALLCRSHIPPPNLYLRQQ
jgi:hypothetical protein